MQKSVIYFYQTTLWRVITLNINLGKGKTSLNSFMLNTSKIIYNYNISNYNVPFLRKDYKTKLQLYISSKLAHPDKLISLSEYNELEEEYNKTTILIILIFLMDLFQK